MDGNPEGIVTAIAPPLTGTHIAFMGRQEDAVRQALESFPGSIRLLAREVGISEGHLRAIRDGRRVATPKVVAMIADALEAMAEAHAESAGILRDSL